ncbi:MAG: universal stress protein [Arenicellales bacterium]
MAFDRILVPLDGSQLAEDALLHAARLARAYHGRLFLLRVLDVHGQQNLMEHGPEDLDWRLYKIQVLDYLNSLTGRLTDQGIEVESHVMEGRAPDQIREFIRHRRIDIVVLCAYGRGGLSAFPLGGTVQKVIAAPDTSVMVIRPTGAGARADDHYRTILVPLDGSQRSAWAVSLVSGMVNTETPDIILLQVVAFPEMSRTRPLTSEELELRDKFVECNRRAAAAYLEEIRKRFSNRLSIRTRLELSPHVVSTIERVADAEDVDLIALTAHGASGSTARSSGSVCQAVVLSARRPVLILQDHPARYSNESQPPAYEWMERRICAS